MTEHKAFRKSLAARGAAMVCMDPDIKGLTPQDLAALHQCKHEILAAMYRLYQVVPQDKADKIMAKYFVKIPVDPDDPKS